jgi:hypothetical protein
VRVLEQVRRFFAREAIDVRVSGEIHTDLPDDLPESVI